MKPYWHDHNPWARAITYVPLNELARCLFCVGERVQLSDGTSRIMTVAWQIELWQQAGDKLDAYIVAQPSGHHSAGVRYGPNESDYISPYCHPKSLQHLLEKYRTKTPKVDEPVKS